MHRNSTSWSDRAGTAVEVRAGTASDLPELLSWLKEERNQTGGGFYGNKTIIERCFECGDGLCAVAEGRILGFAVIQCVDESGAIHIVEAHLSERRRRIGSKLFKAAIEMLRARGTLFIDVECTSPEGEALSRKHGFEDYVDPRNGRRPFDNPTLRLYLSDWRPPVRHPWA